MTDPNLVLAIALHKSFTILVARYVKATNKHPTEVTLAEVYQWSLQQSEGS